MSTRRRKDSGHISDALEHLRMLRRHLERGTLDDYLVRDAIRHRLEVAIDAMGKASPELLEAEAPDDWSRIIGMRNILAHQYADLDQEILQNTIDNRLPGLIELARRLHEVAISWENGEAEPTTRPDAAPGA